MNREADGSEMATILAISRRRRAVALKRGKGHAASVRQWQTDVAGFTAG
jgi:hypothetical protein